VCEVASCHILLGSHLQGDGHLSVVCGQQVHNTTGSAAGDRDALRWVLQPRGLTADTYSLELFMIQGHV
jgi:hypothetical protein